MLIWLSCAAWVASRIVSSICSLLYGSCGERTYTRRYTVEFVVFSLGFLLRLQYYWIQLLDLQVAFTPLILHEWNLQLELFSIASVKTMNWCIYETYRNWKAFSPPRIWRLTTVLKLTLVLGLFLIIELNKRLKFMAFFFNLKIYCRRWNSLILWDKAKSTLRYARCLLNFSRLTAWRIVNAIKKLSFNARYPLILLF